MQGWDLVNSLFFKERPQKLCILEVKGESEVDSSISNHSALKIEVGDSVTISDPDICQAHVNPL